MKSLTTRTLAAAVMSIAMALPLAGQASAGPDDTPGTAGAKTLTDTPEPERPAFYEPPENIPAEPGTIIRSEKAPLLLDPFDLSSKVVTATRVMYSSTDGEGNPIAVTGTVFEPTTAYKGKSERPLISYAPGTQGMGDRCAPSRQMEDFFEYEGIGIARTVSRGYAVAMTDYQGLGTPGTHTYVAREAQGRATLDMARAAKNLEETELDDTNPIGLMGYSQGGGAAAAAAELAGEYAPDLDIKGSAVGAPTAHLDQVGEQIDSGLYSAFALFAVLGLATSERIDPAPYLNEEGKEIASKVEDACVFDLFEYANKDTSQYTTSGKKLSELLAEEPFASAIEEQRLGKQAPNAPVVINHSVGDDVIPYKGGKQLGGDWCDQGTRVSFNAGVIPTHLGGFVPHIEKSMYFFEKRFSGQNTLSSCWRL